MHNQTIPFELHLTFDNVLAANIEIFVARCEQEGGKAILIELARGEYQHQPMFTKVLYLTNLSEALLAASQYDLSFKANGFLVKRIKIEIPAQLTDWVKGQLQPAFAPYFEWHGKIKYERPDELLQICTDHQVHLSLNALKNDTTARFITLREYKTRQQFETRLAQLIQTLNQQGWALQKQQAEYCVYDNNLILDQGWLPN